jgi:NADH dehydrogenase (ubiquinone) flavoprotein 2
MSGRKPASDNIQPKEFTFSEENLNIAKKIIGKYPAEKQASAVIPLLDLAQRQHSNWLPRAAMEYVAKMLSMSFIKVYEVATFYTMFNLSPVGKYFIQVCGTTPCWLRGSENIKETCKKKLNIKLGETSSDNNFTLSEVECLGACANAPVIQINDDYYEDLSPEIMEQIIDDLSNGKKVIIGSQIGRKRSEPFSMQTPSKERKHAKK